MVKMLLIENFIQFICSFNMWFSLCREMHKAMKLLLQPVLSCAVTSGFTPCVIINYDTCKLLFFSVTIILFRQL